MEREKLKLVSRVLVIAIALTMVLPVSSVFLGQSDTAIPEMASKSTTIRFTHAGLEFDNTAGEPALPANMKAANSDKYIVQFKGPIMSEWKQELRDLGAKVHQYVDEYAYVVEMDNAVKANVESLSTVGWVGTYQPAYKVDTVLQNKAGETKMAVYAFDNPELLANKLKNIGTIVDTEGSAALNKVYIVTDASNIPAIAQLSEVSEIYFQAELQTLNNRAGEVEGNHYLWDTTLSGLPLIITGLGIRVGIQDTGWDDGDEVNGHWDFTRGPLGSRMVNSEQDGDEHGTHCTGIVAGNGYCMEEWLGLDNMNQVYHEEAAFNPGGFNDLHGFAGVAPEATVESHAPLGTGDWATMETNGCVVISNSWGPGGAPAANYDSDSNSADNLMAGNDNILVIFAAGNSGPGPQTISGGGQSWMGLSVAASENLRPEGYASSDDPNQLIEFSSRGPMTSGRIKPDISGVGTAVYSTKPNSGVFDEYSDIYRENIVDIYGDTTADYMEMSGTSMACPHIAGHIGLVNQYLRDIDGMPSPNRALVKGILLNGAIDMGYGYPNFQSGWGRVNVKNSLIPDAPRTNQWAEGNLATGQTWDFAIDGGANTYIESDRVPLKVMLNWDMPAGAAMSNDYDLVVTSPSGDIYKGNCFDQSGANEDWSHPNPDVAFWNTLGSPTAAPYGFDFANGGNDDDINNVEAVFIEKPEIGTWTVTVDSDSTPAAPNFALTWGADTGAIDPYKVEMTTQYPTTFSAAVGGTATFPFNILNFGTMPDSISFTDDADADLTVTYSESSPLGLESNEDRSILMQVNAAGGATVGVHTFTITAISLDDPGSPPTQDSIFVKCEVLAEALPFTYQVTTNEMSQYGPSVVAFTDQGGTDHVIIAYASEEQILNGNRVYMKHTTSDLTAGGPATWTKAAVSTNYDSPGDIRITHMPSGTYEDRVFISWQGWDPSDFTDYEGAWAYCSWADPPYVSWNAVQVFDNSDNPTYDDILRMVIVACRGTADEVMFLVESLEYSGGTMQAVDTFGKLSTNGGVSWGAYMQVSPGDGNYYFFPNAFTDHNDNIICNYYWRTPAGTDRDLCYNYWDGSWQPAGAYYMIFDNLENTMFPAGTSTLEGPGGTNRLYVFHTRGTTSDSPKDGYILWADTDGGYPTVETDWNGPFAIHPDVAGSTLSDSNYPDRPILDVDATLEGGTWYVWPQYLESQADYNPYGVYNIHNTVSGDGFSTAPELNKITADAYTKNHQIGDSLDAFMYETYNSYSGNLETGNMDVWLKVYHYDWINDPDIYGPDTSMVGCTPDPAGVGWLIDVQANVDDMSSGFSDIAAAEWCEGATPSWPGTAMGALDGAFDAASEAVIGTADTTGWTLGYHTIWVRGQDVGGYWGEAASGTVEIKDLNAKPDVVVTAPTGIAQIRSGTITISWTATDVEDNSEDLFIDVMYSDDGGLSWNPITSGLLNSPAGTGSTPWDSTAVLDGVNYLVRVEATDTASKIGGANCDNLFSVDNVLISASPDPEAEWFFQVDGPFELNMKPVETSANIEQTVALDTVQPYLVDTWTTTDTFTGAVIDGPWEFDIYGYVETLGTLDAYLYAVVTDGTGAIIDTSINDDVNVGAYVTSNLFTWSDTLAGVIPDGQTVKVEIWLDVLTPGGSSDIWTLVPTDADYTAECWEIDGTPPEGTNINIQYPMTEAAVSVDDGTRWSSVDPGAGDEMFTWSEVTVAADPATITQIDMTFNGQGNAATNFHLWVFGSTGWAATGDIIACAADVDGTLTGSITVTPGDYVIGGVFTWGVYQEDSSDLVRIDFVETVISAIIPPPVFTMEYDYGTTQSSVRPSIGGGDPPAAYDIDHTGASIGDWIFVSFPISVTGAITTIFNDEGAYGDSGTTWDRAYWYNPLTADHWKCYDSAYPGAQDMPNVDNTMGVWLHLTDAGGDAALTTGVEGSQPSGATINLVAGWNLVGYPADPLQPAYTAQNLIDDSGVVTRIERFNGGAAYDIEVMPVGDNFLIGDGYWILATGAYPWVIP